MSPEALDTVTDWQKSTRHVQREDLEVLPYPDVGPVAAVERTI